MSTRARDFFEDEADFEELLEAASSGARNMSDTEFVTDMIEFQETYGLQTFMSYAQYERLKNLAER